MRLRLTLFALALAASPGFAQEPGPFPLRDCVTVELLPYADVERPLIRIGDVVRAQGGRERDRERMLALDLDELPRGATSGEIARAMVEYRLRLAGMDPNSFRVIGARWARVSLRHPDLGEAAFLRAAAAALAERLDTTPDRISVRLASPIPHVLWRPAPNERVALEGRVVSPIVPNAPTQIEVVLFANGKARETATIAAEMPVAPAKAIASKETPAAATSGKTGADFAGPAASASTNVVKTRDRVRLVVRLGSVQVHALGEAEQDGAMGQLIRVRNIDNGKSLIGRVVDAGLVEVSY